MVLVFLQGRVGVFFQGRKLLPINIFLSQDGSVLGHPVKLPIIISTCNLSWLVKPNFAPEYFPKVAKQNILLYIGYLWLSRWMCMTQFGMGQYILVTLITKLCNLSIKLSTFPKKWKPADLLNWKHSLRKDQKQKLKNTVQFLICHWYQK